MFGTVLAALIALFKAFPAFVQLLKAIQEHGKAVNEKVARERWMDKKNFWENAIVSANVHAADRVRDNTSALRRTGEIPETPGVSSSSSSSTKPDA